jgi:hypothetical protein
MAAYFSLDAVYDLSEREIAADHSCEYDGFKLACGQLTIRNKIC